MNGRGPIIYPAYLNSTRRKVGVSLSIPRGISSAVSTMTSVTSFTRTPRGLPRDQWAPCRTEDTRDETSSLPCGHGAHFAGLAQGRARFYLSLQTLAVFAALRRVSGEISRELLAGYGERNSASGQISDKWTSRAQLPSILEPIIDERRADEHRASSF